MSQDLNAQILNEIKGMSDGQTSIQSKIEAQEATVAEMKSFQAEAISEVKSKLGAMETEMASRRQASAKKSADAGYEARLEKFNAELKGRGKTELKGQELVDTTIAYKQYLRVGENGCSSEQKSLLNNITLTDGGYLPVPEIEQGIIGREWDQHGIYDAISKRSMGSNSLIFNFDDADYSTDSEYLNSLANPTQEHDPVYKQATIGSFEQLWRFEVSRSLLEDVNFNLEADVLAKGRDGSMRQTAAQVAIGDGANRPKGILTYVDGAAAQAETYQTIQAVESAAATLGWNDILNVLPSSLTDGYLGNASYVMNKNTFYSLLTTTDTTGNFNIANQINFFSGDKLAVSILGKKVRFDAAVPTVAANANSILFGDFEQAYAFGERTGFSLIVDNVTSGMNIKYILRRRNDGRLLQGRAVKALKMHA